MRLLITGSWSGAKCHIPELRAKGYDVSYLQNERDELPCRSDEIEAVVCGRLFRYHPIEEFVNLKLIQLTSAGMDGQPLEYIRGHGIRLCNAKDVYSVPIAEFVLCGVLQFLKKSHFFAQNAARRHWEKCRELGELAGKRVLIVGCGGIGTACAKRFRAFDCVVTGVNRSGSAVPFFDRVVSVERLPDVLGESDVIILALPLTVETAGLLQAEHFSAMKRSAILVNVARGAIVNTAALIEALREGALGGAVLDVFEDEPLPESSPFWGLDNVILTPHNAFIGEGNADRLWRVIKENL